MNTPQSELDEELAEFVTVVLAPVWEDRRAGGARWCPKWWLHTEVVNRIQDLCDGWNLIDAEEEGISLNSWYRYYLDHHLPIIISADNGPFAACSPTNGHKVMPEPRFWSLRLPATSNGGE